MAGREKSRAEKSPGAGSMQGTRMGRRESKP